MAQLGNLVRTYGVLRREPEVVPTKPVSLVIEPTIRCNLNCIMCDQELRSRQAPDMSLEQFGLVLAQFPFIQKLAIQGVGEPTLNRDFFDMIRLARGRGIYVHFNTNSTTLDEGKIADLVAAGPNEVRLSCDGATRETYERIRRGASFERVIANIRRLSEVVRSGGRPIDLSLWTVLMTENEAELEPLIRLVPRLGLRKLHVQTPHNWGRQGMQSVQAALEVPRTALAEIVAGANRLAAEVGVSIHWLSRLDEGLPSARGCQWPWYSAYITTEGCVTPCCAQGSNPRLINFGNIFEQPFQSIWNSPAYQRFRAALKRGPMPSICVGCPGYYHGVLY
jgi:MoaA/NifB/PqqE/SkfB family radical SAM enzyme